jgi:hypothetical protein
MDLHARFIVHASFSITIGADPDGITKARAVRDPGPDLRPLIGSHLRHVLGENIDSLIAAAGGIEGFIDRVELVEVCDDSDRQIICTEEPRASPHTLGTDVDV